VLLNKEVDRTLLHSPLDIVSILEMKSKGFYMVLDTEGKQRGLFHIYSSIYSRYKSR